MPSGASGTRRSSTLTATSSTYSRRYREHAQMTFPSIREGRSGGRWLLAVALVTALAAALRWYQLGVESLWVDELIMLRVTELNTPTLLRELYTTARAPLYPLLAHFWQMAFGDSQAALRALSALFGTLSVPLVALIGRELFDGRTGLV